MSSNEKMCDCNQGRLPCTCKPHPPRQMVSVPERMDAPDMSTGHPGAGRAFATAFYKERARADALAAILAQPADQPHGEPVALPERDVLRDIVAQAIGGDTYDCTRVWSAWGVGTMSEDDFVPVVEQDERLYEIADACLDEIAKLGPLYTRPVQGEPVALVNSPRCGASWPQFESVCGKTKDGKSTWQCGECARKEAATLRLEMEKYFGLYKEADTHAMHWQRQERVKARWAKQVEGERDTLREEVQALRKTLPNSTVELVDLREEVRALRSRVSIYENEYVEHSKLEQAHAQLAERDALLARAASVACFTLSNQWHEDYAALSASAEPSKIGNPELSDSAERNQCDGCQAGIPLVNGAHRMGKPGCYADTMSCQAGKYASADPSAPVIHPINMKTMMQAYEQVDHKAMLHGTSNWCAAMATALRGTLHSEPSAPIELMGWVPVTERKPERNKLVLVAFDTHAGKNYTTAKLCQDGRAHFDCETWYVQVSGGHQLATVTHWCDFDRAALERKP